MKNIITIILISLMVLNTVGCGGCGSPVEEETANTDIVVETEIEEDYADSLEEIEGGDGTEEEETTEVIEVSVESFEPYQMYTNTSCNVRAQASKDSELVATLSVNTEITVIGVEGDVV